MADALKRSIMKLGLEVDEKVVSKDELEAMDRVDPDYIAHLIANPEELKKAIERYGLTKKAQKEMMAEIYSPPRVVESASQHGLKPGWSLDLAKKKTTPWTINPGIPQSKPKGEEQSNW